MSGPLRVERRPNGVTILTLALPELRNAMTAELTAAWTATIAELKADSDLRAVVVTGEGSAFCSGGDLSWIGESPDLTVPAIRDRMLPFYRAWLAIRDLEVPTVAAINGPAVGAGLCLALACDLRYAASGAPLSAPFTALGMHAGMAATYLLPATVGISVARELLLTGRRVDADEALRMGLVNGVYAADELLGAAIGVAEQIAGNGPIAVRLTVAGLRGGIPRSLDDALLYEALAQPTTFASTDLTEGLAAAKERRKPNFTGH
ncbi:MAG TPA: enoyl-CoA hydratase-related protein [Mycobacteriales bacterium]|jgi:enoyl-CoA hydratase|nr:enoyl-CoA hydratase-related protein [Mycobacteriales bacterium]